MDTHNVGRAEPLWSAISYRPTHILATGSPKLRYVYTFPITADGLGLGRQYLDLIAYRWNRFRRQFSPECRGPRRLALCFSCGYLNSWHCLTSSRISTTILSASTIGTVVYTEIINDLGIS
jgi:hypothetical protein